MRDIDLEVVAVVVMILAVLAYSFYLCGVSGTKERISKGEFIEFKGEGYRCQKIKRLLHD